MWGIWEFEINDWFRELPSKVDDGGIALLAFTSKAEACDRAAKNWGYDSYSQMKADGWGEVRPLRAPVKRKSKQKVGS